MSLDWHQLSAEDMEAHFNPRVAVADAQAHIDRYVAQSAEAREQIAGQYDLRYGARPNETLDLHTPAEAGSGRPLVVFIHGGYWRALDKRDHSFVAPALTGSGAVVANVNYDLCPSVTLDDIVDEIANALRFCHAQAAAWGADPGAIYLLGHSAGAHLAAAMLVHEGAGSEGLPLESVRGVVALTGIYEPEIILGVSVNDEARITREVARRHNCLDRAPRVRPKMLVAVGGSETRGWIEQSTAYASHCREHGLQTTFMEAGGANHFTTLECAVQPGDSLCEAVVDLWR